MNCMFMFSFESHTMSKLTVLSAKSDSGVMLCYQSYQDLESIDHLCTNPILRIGLINK